MLQKLNKARKQVTLWSDDADQLKALSDATGQSQIELLHQALQAFTNGILNRDKGQN